MIGIHLIGGAYGFWLPNDPRGSWSDFVGSWNLFRYGSATRTSETRSQANVEHDRQRRLAAKSALKYPPVEFSESQIATIASGFAQYAERSGLRIWACAIMPDHFHLVVGVHRLAPEQIMIQLKGDATQKLVEAGVHPFGNLRDSKGRPPKCFARGEWKVFLDTPEDVLRSISYVEGNPEKEGRPRQRWPFVIPFAPDR